MYAASSFLLFLMPYTSLCTAISFATLWHGLRCCTSMTHAIRSSDSS